MSRNERWNRLDELRQIFPGTNDPQSGAGPLIYVKDGIRLCDDSEAHINVIGMTGKGKSQCCTLPFFREILHKGESVVVLDPKEECYNLAACRIPSNYQVYCVNFRSPRKSPHRWNPLGMPYRLFKSGDPDKLDMACSQVSELWKGVYPPEAKDPFWPDAAVNYARGLTYGLFETQDLRKIHLDSVTAMMEQSEIKVAGETAINIFYNSLPNASLSKRNLSTYVSAPNDTRASIHSVAAAGIEAFNRSRGLMEMLSEDTLNILDLDVDRPFVLMIILPDETDVYDALAGLLVSQVTQHLIHVAQEGGGRLPIRTNLILEELGSLGRSIPNLPNLAVASRSRNIRLMLVLQSLSQLSDLYGPARAASIHDSIGLTIGFSTNSWETLSDWSRRCGSRQRDIAGQKAMEPLITAAQLAAMPTGTALVLASGRYKFISRLPRYDQLYDSSGWTPPNLPPAQSRGKTKALNFEALAKSLKEARFQEIMKRDAASPRFQALDLDDVLSKIDQKLADLEKEEAGA